MLLESLHNKTNNSAKSMTHDTQKKDLELLIKDGIGFIRLMIKKHDGFLPFGRILNGHGEIKYVDIHDGEEYPDPETHARDITLLYRQLAEGSSMKASAIFTEITVRNPQNGVTQDAIHIALEHRAGFSRDVIFIYEKLPQGEIRLGERLSQPKERLIFLDQ